MIFIYESDLKKLFQTGFSKKIVSCLSKNSINNWAKKNLLFEKALINLEIQKQRRLNKLIESYKNELFSFAYQEKISQIFYGYNNFRYSICKDIITLINLNFKLKSRNC